MTDKSGLGDRMKRYEHVSRNVLTRRTPVILRVDGRAFHTFTKRVGFEVPFDEMLSSIMVDTAVNLMHEIQGAKLAYGQSDEISVLITDYDTLQTDAWFGNVIQKMVSIAASVATVRFNASLQYWKPALAFPAQFDARVFSIPKEEVANYFIWRQQDASRNSVSMVAQSHFSHKKLQGKNVSQMQDMLMAEHGVNWNDTPTHFKRGFCIRGNDGIVVDREVPIFTEDREYIERLVYLDEPLCREGSSR